MLGLFEINFPRQNDGGDEKRKGQWVQERLHGGGYA